MAYIMDMASGTMHPVEEPPYLIKRESRTEIRENTIPTDHPQLQLAMVESTMHAEAKVLPASAVETLIKALED